MNTGLCETKIQKLNKRIEYLTRINDAMYKYIVDTNQEYTLVDDLRDGTLKAELQELFQIDTEEV